MSRKSDRAELMAFALRYPETTLEHPWGEDVVKVRGKIFVFLGVASPDLNVGVKLPASAMFAVAQPFAEPMGYGRGPSGWVSAHFEAEDPAPLDVLLDWIDESYRAVAPRSLSKTVPRWAAGR
jgi:predicted DNA-binding protein (MmcQ/YjbR family)